jgi:hypothetical protein
VELSEFLAGGNINLPSPVDNAGGRISFYFEADCAVTIRRVVILLALSVQAGQGKILLLHLLVGISNVILMERTGL